MVKSSFSGKEIPPGTGIMYVRKDGRILYFLNRKEEKNMLKLRRKPRRVAWTEEYRKEKGQRIALAQHAAEHAAEETPKPKKAAKKAAPKKAANKADAPGVEDLKGVGESTAEVLKKAGYTTIAKIAKAKVEDLKDLEGIGEATAEKFIKEAKEAQK